MEILFYENLSFFYMECKNFLHKNFALVYFLYEILDEVDQKHLKKSCATSTTFTTY